MTQVPKYPLITIKLVTSMHLKVNKYEILKNNANNFFYLLLDLTIGRLQSLEMRMGNEKGSNDGVSVHSSWTTIGIPFPQI